MLRRKAKLQAEGIVTDAFQDTSGVSKSKVKKNGAQSSLTEEQQLEELVFGHQPFTTGDKELSCSDSEGDSSDGEQETVTKKQKKDNAVWRDEDDDMIKVDLSKALRLRKLRRTQNEDVVSGRELSTRLREQFQKLTKQPEWAIKIPKKPTGLRPDSSDDDEGDDDFMMRRTGKLLASKTHQLPAGAIDIKQLSNANKQKKAPAVVQAVEFHPSANVLLTAGLHKTMTLFQVDGETNPVLQSIHLERFPIRTAHFSSNGEEIIMAGRRHWFYVFDMVARKVTRINEIKGHEKRYFCDFQVSPDNQLLAFLGKDGYIPLLSNKTKQWIADFKMNGSVTDVAFTPDNKYLLSTGSDGHVYVWDLTTRDCVHCFIDDGCVKGTCLTVSPNNGYIACGSDSGVVNLYDKSCLVNERPKPVKSIMNLTTSIDCLVFNHTSEILAMSSQAKLSALKLFHTPSLSVFSNWPSLRSPLKKVYCMDFSTTSQYYVVGNDEGKALLYRLNHYYQNPHI